MPVQSADQHFSGSYALLSLPHQQPRPVYPSSQDAIMDQIGDAIDMRPHEGPHIEVEWEPLVLAHVSLTPDPPSYPRGLMRRWRSRPSPPALRTAIDEEECIEEAGQIRQTTLSITDLRQPNIDDEAAGQRHGDLGVYVGGSRLIVDVAMADASAPSYRRPPPRLLPPPNEYHSCEPAPTRRSWEATPPPPRQQRWRPRPLLLSPPRSSSIVRN